MKYDVHIYTTVRVKVCDVEADSQKDAIEKAEGLVSLDEILRQKPDDPRVEIVEWAEGCLNTYLVDEQADEEYENTANWERGNDGELYEMNEEERMVHN